MNNFIKSFKEKINSSLGKDIGLTLTSQLLIMIIAFGVNKILSNSLGVEGYGQYSIIKRSSAVLSFVMLGGMGIALPRYLSGYIAKNDKKSAKSTIISSFLIISFVSFQVILGCYLAKDTLITLMTGNNSSQLYFSAILYAFSLTLCSLLFAYYRGSGKFILFSISQIIIQIIILISVVFYGKNLIFVLNLWTIAPLIYVLISGVNELKNNNLYKDNFLSWKTHIIPQVKTLSNYGFPRLIGDFLLFSLAAFPLIFISRKLNVESSAYFAVGITITAMVIPLFSFLGMVLLPYVSSAIADNNFLKADKLIGKLLILYIVMAVLSVIILTFGIDTFIRLFFSKEFLSSSGISKILVISILSESIYLLLRNPIDASSNIPYNTFNLFISFTLMIVLFLFSHTLKQFAISYLSVSVVKSGLSFISWQFCRRRLLN